MRRYDLVILGAGTTGLVAAYTAVEIGARVALIEADRPGGDCLWTGCVPSKALLASAARAHAFRSAEHLGIASAEPEVDFPAVIAHVRRAIEAAGREDTPESAREKGVDFFAGHGRFAGPGRVEVDGRTLPYRAALIATGSRPSLPPIPGLAESEPLTNESVFELDAAPPRLAVLGGGPIGCELGQALSRLGSEVTIVEAAPRLLPREEPEVGEMLERLFADEGIDVRTQTEAERLEPASGGAGTLHARGEEIAYDRVLVALGREPSTEGLGLDRVGVEVEASGAVRVDSMLRTDGDRIFAAGDVTGGPYFTHFAAYQALIALANALFRARQKVEHEWTPWVTFTDPEIARVGASEEQARERLGREPIIFRHDHAELDRAITAGAEGFSKLVADRRGKLIGATIVGPAAGDALAEVARLVREGRKVADLSQMMHAYPTFAESPARAADEWWTRRWLTPRFRRAMRPALALLRTIDRPR